MYYENNKGVKHHDLKLESQHSNSKNMRSLIPDFLVDEQIISK